MIFETPGTVSAFCSTSETSVSTRSGLAPGYTVTTIRYGVLTFGSRFVFILVIDTKPSISTMMTATSTVNGFLTLNFSIFSYRFSAAPPGATVPPSLGQWVLNIPIIHARRALSIEVRRIFCESSVKICETHNFAAPKPAFCPLSSPLPPDKISTPFPYCIRLSRADHCRGGKNSGDIKTFLFA